MNETDAFNCTQCGASFELLGGGRVKVHVCSYCGTELDVQDDFRVIEQFANMHRPTTPFDLGMTGTLWGVEFTVIGTIGWQENHGGRSWTWVDHQVFSPTHGYAWLTFENEHVTFTRKSRHISSPARVSNSTIENSDNRPRVKLDGETYRYYASGHAQPIFIEGAFNYIPTLSERIRYVSLLGGTKMLDIVEGTKEREYELTALPDQLEVFESFRVAPERLPHPRGVHPLAEIARSPVQLFARNLFLGAALVSLFLTLIFMSAGTPIANSGRVNISSPISLPFTISEANRLTRIDIWANTRNSWAWFDAELLDANQETVAAYEDGVAYYSGREGGESWSEGSQTLKTKIELPPGDYTLELAHAGSEVDWRGGQIASQVQVIVGQGYMNPLWMIGALVLFVILGGSFLFSRGLHNARRWSGSDWSDD